jgi:hypothetical protein
LYTIPFPPGVAWGIKRLDGIAGIRQLYEDGCNMSEVEARFGKEWTER